MNITLDTTKRAARMLQAGRVTVTFKSPSGQHITITAKCRAPKESGNGWETSSLDRAKLIFFSVPQAGEGGWDDKVGRLNSRGFTPERNADPARIWCAKQLLAFVAGQPLPAGLEAHEESRCGVCGRALTDPVSIERGIGPECFGKLTGSQHQERAPRASGTGHGRKVSTPTTKEVRQLTELPGSTFEDIFGG